MKSPVTRAALIAGALSISFAGAAFAQAPQGPAPQPAAQAQKPMKRAFDPAARAQHLREVLQLTPAQEPALQAFLGAGRERRDARQGPRGERQAMKSLTTPERLDRMAAMMAARQQAFAQRADATKRFYAQLTPAQQKAFDALHGMNGRGGKHGMGKHHRGR